MPKYLYPSLPIIAALLVGTLAYQMKLSVLDPPTEAEIAAAPERQPAVGRGRFTAGVPKFDARRLEAALRRMNEDNASVDAPGAHVQKTNPTSPAKKYRPRTRGDGKPETAPADRREPTPGTESVAPVVKTRRRLQTERSNAFIEAKQASIGWGVGTLVLGYVALGAGFAMRGKRRPRRYGG